MEDLFFFLLNGDEELQVFEMKGGYFCNSGSGVGVRFRGKKTARANLGFWVFDWIVCVFHRFESESVLTRRNDSDGGVGLWCTNERIKSRPNPSSIKRAGPCRVELALGPKLGLAGP